MSLFAAFYRLLIRLYPRPFRKEFGAEMEAVFQEQMAEAAEYGRFSTLQVCWREVRDWPFHCFQAHWQVRQRRLMDRPEEPPSWWDTAVSGFPYFLFALFLSASTLYFLFGQSSSFLITLLLGYGFVFVLLLVLIFAWWRGWPTWSVAWLGFLFFILLVLFLPGQLFNLLSQEPRMQPVLMIVSEVGFPLLWLAVLYVLLARWPRTGLVAMLPALGIAWILYLEFVPENISTVVLAMTWIWLGSVAIVLLRWRHPEWDVWLLYLAATVVGMIYIFAGHFLTEMQVRDGTVARMGEDLASELIPSLIPLVGILLLHTLRSWSQNNGPAAITGYRLLLAGVLITMVGVQTELRLSRQGNFSTWPGGSGIWFTAVLLIGCFLMAAGAWSIVKNRRRWQLAAGRPIWLLLGLLLLMPIALNIRWLSDIYNQIKYQQLGIEQFVQQQIELRVLFARQISYLVGIVWLLLAGWVIGRVRPQFLPVSPKKAREIEPSATEEKEVSVTSEFGSGLRKRDKFYIAVSLLVLAALLLPLTTLAILFPNDQVQPFDFQTAFPLFLVMTIAFIMAALLLSSGFRIYQVGARRTAAFLFFLSALLLVKAGHSFYWLMVWDKTYDGLGIFWLFIPISAVFFAAIWMAFTLPEKAKMAAFLYLLLLPPILILTFVASQRVDFRHLTGERAGRVSQALEGYYAEEGLYPENLGQLTPGHLFSLSEPVIIFGQDWCYDGDGDEYRFGYVYREHWSDPRLVGQVYSARDAGAADLPPLCEEEIAALQARDPGYYGLANE